ncbi:MAG: hypothetical protein ACRDL6_00675 [Solirubrobacterales bacterium]
MTADPFAPARRALLIGPLLVAVGGGRVYVGIAGGGLAWLLSVFGGLVALAGLLRLIGGIRVLALERRRKRILREGEPTTAVVNSAKQIATRSGYPIFRLGLMIRRADGEESIVSRTGAIPPRMADSLEPGTELPIMIRREDGVFAVDWDRL